MPTGWTLDDWDETGGPDGSRSAYVEKSSSGPGSETTAGSFGLTPFTVNAPTTLSLEFDYRVDFTGGGGSTKARFEFFLSDGANTYIAAPSPFDSAGTSGWEMGSVTFTVGGIGPVTISALSFTMEARPGQPKWIWLDNLVLIGSGGGPAVALRHWTEVVTN
jgi:hypothetical protein